MRHSAPHSLENCGRKVGRGNLFLRCAQRCCRIGNLQRWERCARKRRSRGARDRCYKLPHIEGSPTISGLCGRQVIRCSARTRRLAARHLRTSRFRSSGAACADRYRADPQDWPKGICNRYSARPPVNFIRWPHFSFSCSRLREDYSNNSAYFTGFKWWRTFRRRGTIDRTNHGDVEGRTEPKLRASC